VRSEFNRSSITVALSCAIGMSVGPTPMVSAVAGLFMKPLQAEFGLSRTAISAILLLSPLAVALFAPLGGRMLDRFGVRRVLLPVVAVFAAANAGMMLVDSVWQYVALAIVISACISVHCYSSYTKVLALWFSRHRGVVTGAMIAGGSGLGAAIIPQLVQPWIADYGWQQAYLGIAALVTFWGFPVLFFILREPRPEERAEPSLHPGELRLTGLEPREAVRTATFWMIGAALFLAPFTIIGTLAHLFPMLTERGVTPGDAANTLSFIYVGGMTGQLSSGFLLDRVPTPRIVLVYFIGAMAGVLILHGVTSPSLLILGAFCLGLGQGSEMSILAYLASRYFGLRHYGAIYGRLYAVANSGIACGLLVMGLAHDATGSYDIMSRVMPLTMLVTIVLFSMLPRYRFARAGDRTENAPVAAPANTN